MFFLKNKILIFPSVKSMVAWLEFREKVVMIITDQTNKGVRSNVIWFEIIRVLFLNIPSEILWLRVALFPLPDGHFSQTKL